MIKDLACVHCGLSIAHGEVKCPGYRPAYLDAVKSSAPKDTQSTEGCEPTDAAVQLANQYSLLNQSTKEKQIDPEKMFSTTITLMDEVLEEFYAPPSTQIIKEKCGLVTGGVEVKPGMKIVVTYDEYTQSNPSEIPNGSTIKQSSTVAPLPTGAQEGLDELVRDLTKVGILPSKSWVRERIQKLITAAEEEAELKGFDLGCKVGVDIGASAHHKRVVEVIKSL